jgi:hypothetical protein
MGQKYELVVFDIGGVLAELTGYTEIASWTGLTIDEAKILDKNKGGQRV